MDNGPRPVADGTPKKSMKKTILTVLATVMILAIGFIAFIFWPGSVSRDEAREIAIEYVFDMYHGDIPNKRANRPDVDFERFRRVWSVEVYSDAGFIYEVFVSRFTGEVVRVEFDRWD